LIRDDHVLLFTRVVATFIIPVLILAVLALYLNPGQTAQNFAWTIRPRMTAMAMGAGYLMGAYFFVRVLTTSRWHRVAAGFLPITAFTTAMALATVLHLDRFHNGQWNAILWEVLYAITPFLILFTWFLNQRTDPGTPEATDATLPRFMRQAVAITGTVALLSALMVFVQPQFALRIWPWSLTPLTGRVFAGWLLLPGTAGIYLWRESRWSGWRVPLESVTVASVFMLIATVIAWGDWRRSNPLTLLFVAGIVGALLFMPATYLFFERRMRTTVVRT
jgi:peptidoglycan/LPS O-acetylase OafA/YrhL